MKNIILNNGVEMPILGYGTYQMRDLDLCEKAVSEAISVGYRSIDTAQAYGNEKAVGAAIAKSGIDRSEFFITTKVWITNVNAEKTRSSIMESLANLQTDYIDLVLIHHPYNDYYASYRELEKMQEEGIIHAIGVSNFYGDRYFDLCSFAKTIPAINQVELHPFHMRDEECALMEKFGTAVEAWAPFAEGKEGLFTHPVLTKIGEQYNKTPAQVTLRYLIENNIIVIPKTVHIERMRENFDVFDFELSKEDHAQIRELDLGHSLMARHHDIDFTEMLIGVAKEREAAANAKK